MGELTKFLYSAIDDPFEWGRNDCLTFANEAHRAMFGEGFADDWLGGYSSERGAALKYARLRKDSPHESIIEALDDRMRPVDTLRLGDGCIVARPNNGPLGWTFGVGFAGMAWFVSEEGVRPSVFEPARDLCWVPV